MNIAWNFLTDVILSCNGYFIYAHSAVKQGQGYTPAVDYVGGAISVAGTPCVLCVINLRIMLEY
jgi:hypothetical protein